MTEITTEHQNHQLSERIHREYPKNKATGSLDSECIDRVKGWFDTGANNTKVAIKLRRDTGREESTKNVASLHDALIPREQRPLNRMIQALESYKEPDPGMVVHVVKDSQGVMRICF